MQYLFFWALALKTQIPHRNCKDFKGLPCGKRLHMGKFDSRRRDVYKG